MKKFSISVFILIISFFVTHVYAQKFIHLSTRKQYVLSDLCHDGFQASKMVHELE